MLPINVSIPNRTVARLEQFRTPQLRIPIPERATNRRRVDWKQTIIYTKSCMSLSWAAPADGRGAGPCRPSCPSSKNVCFL